MKSIYQWNHIPALVLLTIVSGFISSPANARISTEYTKATIGRSSPKKPIRPIRRRKILLDFAQSKDATSGHLPSGKYAQSRNLVDKNPSPSKEAPEKKPSAPQTGFTSQIQIGYSNSAYRYAGEDYPAKSLDLAIAPTYDTTCFSAKCTYLLKILGGFDLNNHGKNELALLQFGLKFPGDPWGGYLAPSYSLLGYLPATPKEINDDKMIFGYGGAFGLATTPELLGTEFIDFSASLSVRKNNHQGTPVSQQDWVTRQALVTNLNFTKTIGATAVFGHIWSVGYDKAEKEVLEMIQMVKWSATDWLDLNLSHSNIGPLYTADGTRLDTDLVSIDNSVISVGFSITNKF